MTVVETGGPTESVPVHEMGANAGESPVWDEDMPARPVRAKLGRLTIGLLVLAIAAAAFYVGVVTEKHTLKSAVATTRAGSARAGAAAAGGAAARAGGATIGQVKLIDGNNIYVTDASGNVVKVATTPDSKITVTNAGTVKDVKPGDTVLVTGSTGSDGTVTATDVRDQGAGGAGFGGFGRGARGGAGGGAATGSPAGG